MTSDYERIEQAIRYIEGHAHRQPRLEEIATHVGLSPFHFQRLFRRWAGTSPKRFLEYLTLSHAKSMLRGSASVLDTALEVGLSGPGRLHDHFVTLEAMTPGEYRNAGRDLRIRYGIHGTPFGRMLLAMTDRGICGLSFLQENDAGAVTAELERCWPAAGFLRDQSATAEAAGRIFQPHENGDAPFHLTVRGTNFQVQVWRALLQIPAGTACSYQAIAEKIGCEHGYRAVAGAVAVNPVAFLIPCHRVLRSTGAFAGYRWGIDRKKAMLAWESAHLDAARV